VLILAIETATTGIGVALADESGVLGRVEIFRGRRHAETLVPVISELLAHTERSRDEISCVAVDVGPGLFTGLRVGVATAKAVALALGVGIVTATSLELLAHELATFGVTGQVAAVLDARRKEVFAALFSIGAGPGEPGAGGVIGGGSTDSLGPSQPLVVERVAPFVASPGEAAERLRAYGSIGCVVGDAAGKYPDAFGEWRKVAPSLPSVAALASLACTRSPISADEVELMYLRPPDAEINWIQR
jgi:tRNA threonylcarbamoyladenosine biosynthesis protein TsaB